MAYKRTSPLPIIEGGLGSSSLTAYSVLAGGTTSTSAVQSVSGLGVSGQVLTSQGAASLPLWSSVIGTATGFIAYKSATTNNVTGNSTVYTVICDTATHNDGSNYNTSTGIYTAPTTGLYFFSGVVLLANVSSAYAGASTQLTTTTLNYQQSVLNPGSGITVGGSEITLIINSLAFMNTGDTASFSVSVSGSTQTVSAVGNAGTALTSFGGVLLG